MKSKIPRKSALSSNILSHGYDQNDNILSVEFKDKSVYHFENVDAHLAKAMEDADSVGSFFHKEIKGKFKHTKIE